ncbi:MAG TPA: glycosyltransferase, partial [Phnomibacter sp.]|nr:glycosyltransferase [Phnomibacter sp.]
MAANDFDNLWQYKKAPRPDRFQRTILLGLVAAGVVAILNLADWWFREEHVANWVLFLLLTFMFWWGILRLMVVWKTWLRIRVPETPAAITGKTVAIFTTSSPGEPLSMFKKTLEACRNIRYPHTTYLLDDTGDPAFREVAEQYGAVWLELKGLPGAKAGKINAALQQTDEEFILVLDPDHIPFPNFLDEVLGFFE